MAELTSGISKLIDRIKNDGVQAGETEKERILSQAKAEAEQILSQARKKADAMISEAEKNSGETRRRTEAEARMAVRDFIAGFREKVRERMIRPIIADHLNGLLEDEQFLGNLVQELTSSYLASGGASVEVMVSPEMKDKLEGWFSKTLSDQLSEKGLVISGNCDDGGFCLKRNGEGFTWDFSLTAISDELVRLVEPALKPYFDFSVEGDTFGRR